MDRRYWTPFGYGLGTTNLTLVSKYSLVFDLYSHDEYTGVLVEQGILGVLLFAGFLFSWMGRIARQLDSQGDAALASARRWFLGLVLSMLLTDWIGTNLKVSPVNVYFWLFCSLLAHPRVFARSFVNSNASTFAESEDEACAF